MRLASASRERLARCSSSAWPQRSRKTEARSSACSPGRPGSRSSSRSRPRHPARPTHFARRPSWKYCRPGSPASSWSSPREACLRGHATRLRSRPGPMLVRAPKPTSPGRRPTSRSCELGPAGPCSRSHPVPHASKPRPTGQQPKRRYRWCRTRSAAFGLIPLRPVYVPVTWSTSRHEPWTPEACKCPALR